jgi:HAD superfamily hydrolase (TIGR01493 family)
MQAYLTPQAFPEVISALDALKGTPMAILSNGSPGMLGSAAHHNGLTVCFAEIISVDQIKTYKPSPRVYALPKRFCSSRRTHGTRPEPKPLATRFAGAIGLKGTWRN